MAARTTNLNLYKPTVGGDTDNWGGFLNNNAAYIDALFAKSSAAVTLHVNNQQIDGTSSYLFDSVKMGDDRQLQFGAAPDYWLIYDSSNTQFELNSTNVNGSGTDGVVFSVSDGTDDVAFTGKISTAQVDILAEGDLRLQDASGGQYVGFDAPATVSGSYTLTLPAAVGSSGQILRTSDGSGTLAWVDDEEGDLKSVADATNGGLTVTNGTGPDVTLALNFNDLSAAAVSVANDSIAIIDASDSNGTRKESIADLATGMGGTGLTGSSGTLNVDASQTQITAVGTLATGTWSATTIAVNKGGTGLTSYAAGDVLYASGSTTLAKLAKGTDGQVLTLASGVPSWATPTTGDITSVTAGDGLSGGGTSGDVTLALDLNELTAAAVNVANDSIAIVDASDSNTSRKESIADLATAMGGTGLTGSSGTLNVDAAQTGITSVGALDGGSITSGFGNIDVGSSNIDGGTITADTALVGTLSTAAQGNITSVGTLTSVTTSGDITMGATDKLYLDGGSNTYIHESSADTMRFFCGGTSRFQIQADGVMIPSGALLYLDNGGNTYITEGSADVMRFYAGGAKQFECSGTNLTVVGALSKGSGSFRIDHPLDSMKDTHDLVHSFIEGPKADLIYRGSVQLSEGTATVDLDDAATMTNGTWELLCRDPQVWVQNEDGWTQVRGSVSGSTLTITAQDGDCTDTVSWLVVAERQDEHMMDTNWTDDDGRVIVEPEKDSEPEGSESEDDGA